MSVGDLIIFGVEKAFEDFFIVKNVTNRDIMAFKHVATFGEVMIFGGFWRCCDFCRFLNFRRCNWGNMVVFRDVVTFEFVVTYRDGIVCRDLVTFRGVLTFGDMVTVKHVATFGVTVIIRNVVTFGDMHGDFWRCGDFRIYGDFRGYGEW